MDAKRFALIAKPKRLRIEPAFTSLWRMSFPLDLFPDPYILFLVGAGLLIALVAWLPLVLRQLPLSLPIVCIGLGAAIFAAPQMTLVPLPSNYPEITERFSEFVVIIALMGAGLKIDRIFGFRDWSVAWRLIGITMPLSIAAITLIAGWWVGLSWTVALLIGAALAPTDPVLAADVQVGPPKSGGEDEVRFGLTAEAGLNDGFAFPFVHLAIALALAASTGEPWFTKWLTYNVLWEIGVGVIAGYVIGKIFGWLTFHVPAKTKLAKTGDGLIALSATFVSYGLTELIHCYGFLAVFVTALTFREWNELSQPISSEISVGFMGIGELGRKAAAAVAALGFPVNGWSRRPAEIAGMTTFAGADGLPHFLAATDILVVLLPLTPATQGIITYDVVRQLRRDNALGGSVLINAGRGGLQRETEILRALDEGLLGEASLDVFETEPLPESSPLWRHPKVFVTPHAAAASDPRAITMPMLKQMDAYDRGEPLKNLVDRAEGY